MKRIGFVTTVMFLFLFGLSAATMAEEKEETIRMRIPSCLPIKVPGMAALVDFVHQLELISGGTIRTKLYEPGQIVPVFEIQEAVSKKQVEAGWSAAVYLSGQMPAASLFTTIPFGPNVTEYMAWFYLGNGIKLYQEMYDKYGFNVKVWPLMLLPTEGGGWFNKQINTVEDLKGLRLRWPGLGGKVLSKLGASISTIPGGEIFTALEKGVLDGTELAGPYFEKALGFYKVAKYNYFPGWHQSCTAMEFTMNKDIWNSMSERQKELLEIAIVNASVRSLLMYEAFNGRTMKENAEKHGVKNLLYPPEVLKALQDKWLEVVAEESAKDAFFKKVWEDIKAFMKEYQVWEVHAYSALPPQKFE